MNAERQRERGSLPSCAMRSAAALVVALVLLPLPAAAEDQTPVVAFTTFEASGNADGIAVGTLDGTVRRLTQQSAESGGDCCPTWSPDGGRIAFSGAPRANLGRGLHVISADGSGMRRLTCFAGSCDDGSPAWSPVGDRIAYLRGLGSAVDVWVVDADVGAEQRLTSDGGSKGSLAWSPDGARLLWRGWNGAVEGIFVLELASGRVTRIVELGADPSWSPDGSRIAFGGDGLWVVNRDGTAPRQLSPLRASYPKWSPDGSQIAFVGARPTGEFTRTSPSYRLDVFVVGVDGGEPRRLTGPLDDGFTMPAGDGDAPLGFSPDGSRILFTSIRSTRSQSLDPLWTTYQMNADGTCEQPYAPGGPLLVGPVWRPRAPVALQPLRCADLRVGVWIPPYLGLGRNEPLSIRVENDGNLTATGVTVRVQARGPVTLRPLFKAACEGEPCTVGALAPGAAMPLSYQLRAQRPGRETIRVSVAAREPDPDRTAGARTAVASVLPCTILGTDGDDTVLTGRAPDRICGLGGRDRIESGRGADYVDGGSSADRIDGGRGRDRLVGGGGPDTVVAWDEERDVIACGDGVDVVLADRVDRVAADCEHVARR
jgi:Tol biopolymer transport system component